MSKRIETEIWAVKDLRPYEKNAKKHSPEQVKTLAGLIKEHGWTQPIVVDGEKNRGSLVVGHGRRLAAIELGLEKVPVRVLYGYSEAEIDALRIADNRVTSTDYDTSLLQEEIAKLDAEGIDVLGLGFSEKEVEFLTSDLGEFDENMFVEDIVSAVEKQTEENRAAVETTDSQTAHVGDALGFKRVTVAQLRAIRGFMSKIETKTGKKGVEALVAHIEGAAA